jgi:hypothetical protein
MVTAGARSAVEQAGAFQFIAREGVHRLPRRNAQREIEQFSGCAHLGGVLREPPDVALNEHEVLGRIVRRRRIVAAVAEPDLMH